MSFLCSSDSLDSLSAEWIKSFVRCSLGSVIAGDEGVGFDLFDCSGFSFVIYFFT